MKKLLWLVFGLFSFLPVNEVYAVSAPDFSTINLQGRFTSVGSSSGAVLGSSANNYIDIVGDAPNRPGGIWFDETMDLDEDFRLEMYFALGWPTGFPVAFTPSEGWAFVMQSEGTDAIAAEGGQSLGVWANRLPSGDRNAGAIQDGFAVEFDTFRNANLLDLTPNMFDNDISLLFEGGSHIAWGYPGRAETYRIQNFGTFLLPNNQKVMTHQGISTYRDINDILGLNTWRPFTITYTASTSELTYSSYWMSQDVTLELDRDAFADPSMVYFGFTGSNSGYAQQRSVAFRRLEIGNKVITPDDYESESTVSLTGNMEVDGKEILDVNTGSTPSIPVEELPFDEFTAETNEDKKTFTYNIVAEYKNSASEELKEGAELTIRVPDIFEIKRDPNDLTKSIILDIDGVSVEFEPAPESGFSKESGEYKRIDNQYVFLLPKLLDGATVSISLPTVVKSDLDLIIDEKIDLEEVFSASFKKDELFVETGERDDTNTLIARPRYQLKAIFGPTLSGVPLQETLIDAKGKPGKYINLGSGFSMVLEAEDLNSTVANVYASDWLDEAGVSSLPDFNVNDYDNENLPSFKRESISESFENEVLNVAAEEFNASGEYFRVFHLVDKEGNISSPRYLKVTVLEKGVVELTGVPNLLFQPIDLAGITVVTGGFVSTNLLSGDVDPVPGLGDDNGNNVLDLVVDNKYGTPASWRLNARLNDFVFVDLVNETLDTNRTIPASGIQLHMDIEGNTAIVNNENSLVREAENSAENFRPDPENIDAALKIKEDVIRAGTFQGAITWELVDSIQ